MKILWGFEPLGQDSKAVKGMYGLLQQFTQNSGSIDIGYVTTGNETVLSTAFDVPLRNRFSIYPKKLILNDLRNAAVSVKASNIHIVHYPTLSTTKTVDRFFALSKTRGAEIIALYTHNKKGFKRLLLGSFAETAIHRSKIDLLVVNPKTKFKPVRKIFFASDFSAGAKKELEKVIDICKQLGASLTVFHAAQGTDKRLPDEIASQIIGHDKKTKNIKQWIKLASEKADVQSTVVIKTDLKPIVALALAAARRTKANLFVVKAKVGSLSALMGGSFTRQVIRDGTFPVLVLKRD